MLGLGNFLHGIKINIVGEGSLSGPVNKAIGDINKLVATTKKLKAAGRKMMIAGAVMGAALLPGIASATGFQAAMGEVSTLVDTNVVDMKALGAEVKQLSAEFGSMPVSTAKGFYQTISAGFADAAEATQIMTASLKLARGGITTTETAVDGLTSVLNAYGLTAKDSALVSDSMFTAMRLGKTTIGALAGSLGRVAPLAKSAGLSIDEMNAAVAALTLGGLSTEEATTSLRGMMTNIIKPMGDARKKAKELGIEFSTKGIKAAGGFAKWMQILTEKTGGTDDNLGKLFGNIRGLVGALALTGAQSGKFTNILEEMGMKAGATETAFKKMDAQNRAAFDKAKASAAVALISAFESILPVITPIISGFAKVAGAFAKLAEAHPILMGVVIGAVALTSIVLVLGGMMIWLAGSLAGAALKLHLLSLAEGEAAGMTNVLKLSMHGLKTALAGVGKAMIGLLMNPVFLAVVAVAALAYGAYLLIKHWDKVVGFFRAVGQGIAYTFTILLDWFKAAFGEWWYVVMLGLLGPFGLAVGLIVKYWDEIKSAFSASWKWIYNVFLSVKAWMSSFWAEWKYVILGGLTGPLGLAVGLIAKYWENITSAFDSAKAAVIEKYNSIVAWFEALPDRFYQAGMGMIDALAKGIQARWSALKASFMAMFGWIRDFLPGSDAKRGPLSDLTRSGRAFFPTFAKGLEQGAPIAASAVEGGMLGLAPGSQTTINEGGAASTNTSSRSVSIQLGDVHIHAQNVDEGLADFKDKLRQALEEIGLEVVAEGTS